MTSWRKSTGDVDYVDIIPSEAMNDLERIAGRASEVATKRHLYFQHVGMASLPGSYAERLTALFPDHFEKLRLFAVEAHDLALSKLARNSPVDREDVAYLARTVPLDPDTLSARYRKELRPVIVGDPGIHDQTLAMWVAAFFPA